MSGLFGRSLRAPLLALLLAGTTLHGPALAQESGPTLVARVAGINSEAMQSRKLLIDSLDIRVRIHGSVAETIVTARFGNAGRDNLEGEFTLAMPAGSVVTGYALDVNGRMVDGVLVDQRQARIAYEARVRQRIDPGLAEVGRDNVFRTRVFPILPGSGRTIRLRFSSPLDPNRGYALPLRDGDEIGAFSLQVEAAGLARPPRLRLGDQDLTRWTSEGGIHRYALERRETRLGGDLVVDPTPAAATMLVSRHGNGQRFFQIADSAQGPPAQGTAAGRVAILWDRSLSRADDDLAEEQAIVRQYLDRVRPSEIELVLFDSGGVERVRVRDAAEAVERLRAVRYRGATSLAVLAGEQLTGNDACLLFSDGLVTIDRREDFRPGCPIFALSSAAAADRLYLASLARGTGGEGFDLRLREAAEVLTRMTRRVPRVVDIRSTGGSRVDFSILDGGEQGWRIVAPLPASGDVVVRLAGLGPDIVERVYSPQGQVVEMDGAGALWAADRVAVRAASDDMDRESLVEFSRNYSVASPQVSFVVLETGRDYANSRIEPPASAPAAWRDDYLQLREQLKEQETAERGRRLETVLAQWQEMRSWWATRFDPASRPKPEEDEPDFEEAGPPLPMAPPPPPPPAAAGAPGAPAGPFWLTSWRRWYRDTLCS